TAHFHQTDSRTPAPSPLPLPDALPILDRRASRYRHLVVTLSDGTPAITSMVFGLQRHLAVAAGRLALATRDAYGTRVYDAAGRRDRKSTRLNSSHVKISYAVFCLKKKK